MADKSGKYRSTDSAARGQKIRSETGRDRSDDEMANSMVLNSDLKGDAGDISHSIQNGKVPRDA
jgi:hypothetical protein